MYSQIHNFERHTWYSCVNGEIKPSAKVSLEKHIVFTTSQRFKISIKQNQDQIMVLIITTFLTLFKI